MDEHAQNPMKKIIIALILVALAVVAFILLTQEKRENSARTTTDSDSTTMNDASNSELPPTAPASDTTAGTRLAGDSSLETMDGTNLAADGGTMSDSGLMVDADAEVDSTFLPEPQPGEFIEYADGTLAYAETGDVVLFFHADWCPSCRGLENDINANLSAIPDGVSIQKVDYDSETELKKKYGIVRQHTLVQVNANGDKIQDLNGLNNTLAQVVNQL